MTRQGFLQTLKRGLAGLPASTIDEIAADYEAHFAEGASAGRTEAEVAAALGDPARLAKELRAEAGLKRWQTERNPAAAGALVLAVLGLATIDIMILFPVLVAIGSILFAAFVVAIALLVAGAAGIGGAAFGHMPVELGPLPMVFGGLGLMSLSVALGAVLIPTVIGLLDLLGRYARLHFRLLQPALQAAQPE
jgi:uncharacterized membrane protein